MKNISPIRLVLLCAIGFGVGEQLSAMNPSQKTNEEKFLEAINNKDITEVKKLANNISDINKLIGDYPPIYYAARYGNLEIVKYLIEKGANINAELGFYKSVLSLAARYGNLKIVKYLIENEADINAKSGFFKSVLNYVARLRKWVNNDCEEALINAAFGNHLEIVKYLIEKNNNRCPLQGSLEAAAAMGSLDVAKYLIKEKGANINAKDSYGMTALHYAAHHSNLEIVKYLIENGANINTKDNVGATPLHYAAKYDSLDVVAYLIRNEAEINAKDYSGQTPLHYAAKSFQFGNIEYLIENRAEINAADKYGRTPLHYAAKSDEHAGPKAKEKYLNIVKYLIEKGANINVADKQGFTALNLAQKSKDNEPIARYLRSKEISEQTKKQQPPSKTQEKAVATSSNPAATFSFIAIWYNRLSDYIGSKWKNLTSLSLNPQIKGKL